ncbi:MAG: transcriptional regulator PpsR, partial [Pseudomonadota bacterium]
AGGGKSGGKGGGKSVKSVRGRAFVDFLANKGRRDFESLISEARSAGRSMDGEVFLNGHRAPFQIAVSYLRQYGKQSFLIRLRGDVSDADANAGDGGSELLAAVIENMPDCFVLTNNAGDIISANSAFVDLAQLSSIDSAVGLKLERFFGRAGVDYNVLRSNLRDYDSLRFFATTFVGASGAQADVEISAVTVSSLSPAVVGFLIRDMSGRIASPVDTVTRDLPKSVTQMTELVGRVPLKDLVRETTDIIERLCIEAALQLTGDNRASAAEMLGLSRQSLYVKLRRFGIMDATGDT